MNNDIKNLAIKLGNILLQKHLTVSSVESCTGGGIAYAITSVSGSSDWFNQSFVTYSNEAKQSLVQVQKKSLEEFGAVSKSVVEEMAEGGRKRSGADLVVSVSGIAGPTGGTDEKPVGTVWMAISTFNGLLWSECYHFSGDRDVVRDSTIAMALEKLCEFAVQISK